MRKYGLPLIGILLIVFDQLVKSYVVANIELNEILEIFPPIFNFTYLRNYGAAFSSFQNQHVFFLIVTVAVVGYAIYYYWKHLNDSYWMLTGLMLIISGGIGNFIDRLRLGYVVDMVKLEFVDFAIFNVADSCLTIGVLVLLIAILKDESNGN